MVTVIIFYPTLHFVVQTFEIETDLFAEIEEMRKEGLRSEFVVSRRRLCIDRSMFPPSVIKYSHTWCAAC